MPTLEGLESMTVLVVDNSMLIRHTLCRWLEGRGFTVHSACNGAEALLMMPHVEPDVIITDVQMPCMDGHQLIERLKIDPKTSHIPVVLLASRQGGKQIFNPDAHATIYKDKKINDQLDRAIDVALTGAPLPEPADC